MAKFADERMSACLQDIAKKYGRSLRCIATVHNNHEATVRLRVKKLKAIESGEDQYRKVGHPCILWKEEEMTLAQCINVICKNGFSSSIDDVRLMVSDYVKSNKIEAPFKHNLPGRKWMQRFLNDNNLSLKKVTLIAKVRKDCIKSIYCVQIFFIDLNRLFVKTI